MTSREQLAEVPAGSAPRRFRVDVPQEVLDRVRQRVASYRWDALPEAPDAEAVGAEAVGAEAVGAEAVSAEAVGAEASGWAPALAPSLALSVVSASSASEVSSSPSAGIGLPSSVKATRLPSLASVLTSA